MSGSYTNIHKYKEVQVGGQKVGVSEEQPEASRTAHRAERREQAQLLETGSGHSAPSVARIGGTRLPITEGGKAAPRAEPH